MKEILATSPQQRFDITRTDVPGVTVSSHPITIIPDFYVKSQVKIINYSYQRIKIENRLRFSAFNAIIREAIPLVVKWLVLQRVVKGTI